MYTIINFAVNKGQFEWIQKTILLQSTLTNLVK